MRKNDTFCAFVCQDEGETSPCSSPAEQRLEMWNRQLHALQSGTSIPGDGEISAFVEGCMPAGVPDVPEIDDNDVSSGSGWALTIPKEENLHD